MNTFLLVLLCIFEVAFAVTAISRRADKKGWQLGRLICNGGQLGLFLVMLIAPGVDMSFRFMGLFVLLIIRIIFAVIDYLIMRNKEAKAKHPAMSILSAVLSVILISGSMIPSFVISDYDGLPVSGQYEIAEANAILVDRSRTEGFETDGSNREVPVCFYYPANAAEGEKFPLVLFSHGKADKHRSKKLSEQDFGGVGFRKIKICGDI